MKKQSRCKPPFTLRLSKETIEALNALAQQRGCKPRSLAQGILEAVAGQKVA